MRSADKQIFMLTAEAQSTQRKNIYLPQKTRRSQKKSLIMFFNFAHFAFFAAKLVLKLSPRLCGENNS